MSFARSLVDSDAVIGLKPEDIPPAVPGTMAPLAARPAPGVAAVPAATFHPGHLPTLPDPWIPDHALETPLGVVLLARRPGRVDTPDSFGMFADTGRPMALTFATRRAAQEAVDGQRLLGHDPLDDVTLLPVFGDRLQPVRFCGHQTFGLAVQFAHPDPAHTALVAHLRAVARAIARHAFSPAPLACRM